MATTSRKSKVYKVGLCINSCGFEKHTTTFLEARGKKDAEKVCMALEAHDSLRPFEDGKEGWVTDGEFVYYITDDAEEVPQQDVAVIKKYMTIHRRPSNNFMKDMAGNI